jgi:crotonobetainyl-CoA:carnitine CoA-transferase CaiB-like acyl-CoA transferase
MGVAAGPVLSATSLLGDAHLAATGFWVRAERAYVGTHVVPRAPYRLDGVAPRLRCPAPTLGQHNAEILREILDLPAAEIAALERAGVIGTTAI